MELDLWGESSGSKDGSKIKKWIHPMSPKAESCLASVESLLHSTQGPPGAWHVARALGTGHAWRDGAIPRSDWTATVGCRDHL